MDTSNFATTFSPYEAQIVDTIAQLLLPAMTDEKGLQIKGIKAELYKLNVCMASLEHGKPLC